MGGIARNSQMDQPTHEEFLLRCTPSVHHTVDKPRGAKLRGRLWIAKLKGKFLDAIVLLLSPSEEGSRVLAPRTW